LQRRGNRKASLEPKRESRASRCVLAHITTDVRFRIHRSRFSFEVQSGRRGSHTQERIKPPKHSMLCKLLSQELEVSYPKAGHLSRFSGHNNASLLVSCSNRPRAGHLSVTQMLCFEVRLFRSKPINTAIIAVQHIGRDLYGGHKLPNLRHSAAESSPVAFFREAYRSLYGCENA
jgi:hypothetical protein